MDASTRLPNPRRVPECKVWQGEEHDLQAIRVEGWAEFSVCLKCGRVHQRDTRPKGTRECLICQKPMPPRAVRWCGDSLCWTRFGAYGSPTAWSTYIHWRDKEACRKCGVTGPGARLEAHHIQPVAQGGIECDPENGILLCHECHQEEHRRLRAG